MGVISTTNLSAGLCFGPIPTSLMIADAAFLVANMTTDVFPEIPQTEINLLASCELHHLIEWVPFLRSARCPAEQCLELIREANGDIVYRTCRNIRRGEELLIWFSEEYRQQIGMSIQLPPSSIVVISNTKHEIYTCPACSASFRFPFPYLSHVTFKCNYSNTKKNSTQLKKMIDATSFVEQSAEYFEDESYIDVEDFEATSSPVRGVKRRSSLEATHPFFTVKSRANASAFHKVQKGAAVHSTINNNNNNNIALTGNNNKAPFYPMLAAAAAAAYGFFPLRLSLPNEMMHHSFNHHLNMTGLYHPSNTSPYIAMTPQIPQTQTHPHLSSSLPTTPSISVPIHSPLSDASTVTSMENYHAPSVAVKSSNPMVEKLLHSAVIGETVLPNPLSSLNLTQNWCAKCNATFRMTSDLVYHMRTHHKRDMENESDNVVTRRRNEKLCCHICGESFKERHHLTRHMTSHD